MEVTLNQTNGNTQLTASLIGANELAASLTPTTTSSAMVATVSGTDTVTASLVPTNGNTQLTATLEQSTSSSEPDYDGSYTVTPKFIEQVLETKNKALRDNVTVTSIPVTKVSNTSGGVTVTIGG